MEPPETPPDGASPEAEEAPGGGSGDAASPDNQDLPPACLRTYVEARTCICRRVYDLARPRARGLRSRRWISGLGARVTALTPLLRLPAFSWRKGALSGHGGREVWFGTRHACARVRCEASGRACTRSMRMPMSN